MGIIESLLIMSYVLGIIFVWYIKRNIDVNALWWVLLIIWAFSPLIIPAGCVYCLIEYLDDKIMNRKG